VREASEIIECHWESSCCYIDTVKEWLWPIDSMRWTSDLVCNSIPSLLLRSVRGRGTQPQNFCSSLLLFAVTCTGVVMPAPGGGTISKAVVTQRNPPGEEEGYSSIPPPAPMLWLHWWDAYSALVLLR